MSIESQCRAICITNKIAPDADAPEIFQTMPGFQKDEDGRVKQWHTWIGTVQAANKRQSSANQAEKKREKNRKYLQRVIDETSSQKHVTESGWQSRLSTYRDYKEWPSEWGYPPESPRCQCPRKILNENGFRPDVKYSCYDGNKI